MAVLEKIREKTVTILVVIGLALFAFVVDPDAIMKFFNNNSSTKFIGEILGENIEYSSFDSTYQMVKSKSQNATDEQILEQAWQLYVIEQIFILIAMM